MSGSQPFFPTNVCGDPTDQAIQNLADTFKSIENQVDQILSNPAEAASGSLQFCPGQVPPFNWGTPPTQQVAINGPVVTVYPSIFDDSYGITVGDVTVNPYVDFFPQSPEGGAFGTITPVGLQKQFDSSITVLESPGPPWATLDATLKQFTFPNPLPTTVSIGMIFKVTSAANHGNIQSFVITAILSLTQIICGDAIGIVDDTQITGDLVSLQFTHADDGNGSLNPNVHRLLILNTGDISKDGIFLITSYISPSILWYNSTSLGTPPAGSSYFSVAYNVLELLNMIAGTRLENNPTVAVGVDISELSIKLIAKTKGAAGNSIAIALGSNLSFLCSSGASLFGGLEGDLLKDNLTMESAVQDVLDSTNTITSLGGVSVDDLTLQQNVIPPNSSGEDLRNRLSACGFSSVGGVPLVRDSTLPPGTNNLTPKNRMQGYLDFVNLCGFGALRSFLSTASPGNRYVIAIDLVPTPTLIQGSCGTSELDSLVETPICPGLPKDYPDAVRFYVFHHTYVNVSSASITELFNQGFNSNQIATIVSPNGGIGFGVVSTVLTYTTAIEEALAAGFTLANIESILDEGIEDWIYDASRDILRTTMSSLLSSATSDEKKSCCLSFIGALDNTKLSGTQNGRNNINSNVCAIVSAIIKKVINFLLDQMDKLNSLLKKINDIAASLSKALSLNNFLNKTLDNYPSSTLRCLVGGIDLSIPSLGLPSTSLNPIENFANNINSKINLAGSLIQGVLGRSIETLALVQKSICILKTIINNMIGSLIPGATVLNCITSDLNLRVPNCVIDFLNEVKQLLGSINSSLNLALNVAANLAIDAIKMTTIQIQVQTTSDTCSDSPVTKFLSAVGLGGPISATSL